MKSLNLAWLQAIVHVCDLAAPAISGVLSASVCVTGLWIFNKLKGKKIMKNMRQYCDRLALDLWNR